MLWGCDWVFTAMLLECYFYIIVLLCGVDEIAMLLGCYRDVIGMLWGCYRDVIGM